MSIAVHTLDQQFPDVCAVGVDFCPDYCRNIKQGYFCRCVVHVHETVISPPIYEVISYPPPPFPILFFDN
jgi:hypothetical protein